MSTVYGILEPDMEAARQLVERALGITFSAHESLYRGGDCYRYEENGVQIILQRNHDALENEPAELSAPEIPLLLYVSDKAGVADLDQKLESAMGDLYLIRKRTRRGAQSN